MKFVFTFNLLDTVTQKKATIKQLKYNSIENII